ncbi:putative metal-dependent HD superfamily phosphohydrolase [Dysgonomonas sp. PFB1-18]|uniref:HD domain-containing protein n=1 Tax=unclassified Dysgonomonas TaxID=2630389 RepID=UPI00247685AF|nr:MULTISPECIES: hypothetical protein [unclassified Dysgonomonas]MDH6307374.1 putative metal-dependent HD superfamily phosphohydrolase [Dysgonomonas sp. PF1-14]MDH6337292.1 putative metal-dependent HD superfamily phosphohydrolase [Dysgonomonas sp. PF1-16]MDH6379216.1 putative metal-dependent HD superfamily phosphohydrolase [Dysgonomonas sp. PFB1-18]MDH6396146.1 putative metal-dependent HD superfamily phosphohydrolase [Dysgonomonas sp. PF1-23]
MIGLEKIFIGIAGKHTDNSSLTHQLWREISEFYASPGRFYHTLSHLEKIIMELKGVEEYISDWDTILFSTFYHDIVYNVQNDNNEEDSAELAAERLNQISYPQHKVEHCISQILTTKGHAITEDLDTNLFIDADLAILGQEWDAYYTYSEQVRKEYAIYSDAQYKAGRKKVLEYMLSMKQLYKTECFIQKYEEKARKNIQHEIQILEK